MIRNTLVFSILHLIFCSPSVITEMKRSLFSQWNTAVEEIVAPYR